MSDCTTYVVIDTHVANRSLLEDAEYRDVIEKIVRVCHRIKLNDRILDQYRQMANKAGVTSEIVLRKLMTELAGAGKVKKCRGKIDDLQKVIGFEMSKNDRPFLEVALLAQAKYLISNDPHFHNRYKEFKEKGIEVVYPESYVKDHC